MVKIKKVYNDNMWEKNPWTIHQYEMNSGFMLLYGNFVILLCYDQTSTDPIRTLTMLISWSDPQDPQP